MNRRDLISLLGGAAAWPLAARAQQADRIRRVAVLMGASATEAESQSQLAAFTQGLRQLGWIEGQNLRLEVRWSAGDAGSARIYAAQLIGLMPEVIVAHSTINLTVIRQATNTVPVVFLSVAGPVAQGFVQSLSRPGGNLTGFSLLEFSLGGKWVDLLKQAAPDLGRVAVVFSPDAQPAFRFFIQSIEAAAASLGVEAMAIPIRAQADIDPTLISFARQPKGGLIVLGDAFTRLSYPLIAALARRLRLPSISPGPNLAKSGGLMDYGPNDDLIPDFRQAATYVDRILKGAKPAELPVQGADRYRLVINLDTARVLGLTVPPGLLAIADEVIE
jgi:putative ABC transport system substrate-binding protein